MPAGHKTKSARQVRFLMSSGSPLTRKEKGKLTRELHSGAVKVRSSNKKPKR